MSRGRCRAQQLGLGLKGGRAGAGADARILRSPPLSLPHLGRRKKLRFHPRQLYLSVKQGELQKVILMLCECFAHSFKQTLLEHPSCVRHRARGRGSEAVTYIILALTDTDTDNPWWWRLWWQGMPRL